MSLRHPPVGGQERHGSRAHLCDEPAHRAPNWKFCKFKHGEPSATRLTPARVRRGFRSIRQALPDLASAPKPGKPGPGRPPGSKNRRPATRHDVGKTVKRAEPGKKPAGRKVK